MNKAKFQPDDIVWLKHQGRDSDDPAPKYLVNMQYPYDIDIACAGKVLCNRFTYSQIHQLCEEVYRRPDGETVIKKIHELLLKVWGKHWFYVLHEQYLFDPEQLELLNREDGKSGK